MSLISFLTRAQAYKTSFGLIPSYMRCGRQGVGGGWVEVGDGAAAESQSPGGSISVGCLAGDLHGLWASVIPGGTRVGSDV